MTESREPELSTEEQRFLNCTYRRIFKLTIVLETGAVTCAVVWFGWMVALGVALGGVVAYLNLRWLHRGTEQMTQRMVAAPSEPAPFRFSWAFFGRYLFVFAIGYVIFKSSAQALYGFLAALLVPVGAMMGEAAYQALAGGKTSSDA